MAVPRSYLLVPPDGDSNPFGRAIPWTDFVRWLKTVNPRIYHTPVTAWGMTTLWNGVPHAPGSKSISAMNIGDIPEWTQVDDKGMIIAKGWRAILKKVVQARAARKEAIERVFRVSLDLTDKDGLCRTCIAEGQRRPVTSASGLCNFHDSALDAAKAADEGRKEAECLSSKSRETSPRAISFPVSLDM